MPRKIQVIINPASGQHTPILNTLNDVFHQAGLDWEISIIMEPGDALRFAQEAVAAKVDVIAAYGDDDILAEVAEGMENSGIPLAILPGGTANLLAQQLSVPLPLREAAELLAGETLPIYGIDLGQISNESGEQLFMLRVGVCPTPHKAETIDQKLIDKYGLLAYSVAAIKSLTESDKTTYNLTIDGRSVEVEGYTCLVDNGANMGYQDVSFGQAHTVHDGFVDLIVIKDLAFRDMYSIATSVADLKPNEDTFSRWQARELTINAASPQTVHADGEVIGNTPITIRILPQKFQVLSPLATGELVTAEPAPIKLGTLRKDKADHRLIIIKYPSRAIAEQALARVKQLNKEDAVQLVDAVLVEKNSKGKLKIEPVDSLSTKKGLKRGGAAGLVLGILGGAPALALILAGGAVGAVWGKLGGHKLESRLKEELGTVLEPGEAAICNIVEYEAWQAAYDRSRYLDAEVITTELSQEEYNLLVEVSQEEVVTTAVIDDK